MKKIGIILIGLLLCISCGKQEKVTKYKKFKEESYGNFDTITFFVGYAEKEKDFKEASALFADGRLASPGTLRKLRRHVARLDQDPTGALTPTRRIGYLSAPSPRSTPSPSGPAWRSGCSWGWWRSRCPVASPCGSGWRPGRSSSMGEQKKLSGI